jgi:hypothetical protein
MHRALLPVILVLTSALLSADACTETVVEMVPAIDVTTWPPAPFRWIDVGNYLYAESYRNSYEYADASVIISFQPCADWTFSGTISATNLKPNFAYQAKLVGKPTRIWDSEGDDLANELIGYTGRWWRSAPTAGNSNDAEYETYHEDPDYIFEGYLLFDFFVTDAAGNAELPFFIDSSYHVLWWEHQRTPQSCDSPVKWSTVVADSSNPAYGRSIGPTNVGVYAEIERQCYTTTQMLEGAYDCRFLLTEESFHQSGDYQGYWASAMACDTVYFEVGDPARLAQPPSAPPVILRAMYPNPLHGRAHIELCLEHPVFLRLGIYDAAGRLVAEPYAGIAPRGSQRLSWNGRDGSKQSIPTGQYYYRVETPDAIVGQGRICIIR